MSSMTPPIRMVSGPVEPIVRDIASQLGASIAELGFPVGLGIAPPEEMCLKAARGIVALYGHTLTAAPVREEGGAVLADACQTAARSYAETGDDYMVGLLLKAATALATREEASAEAGEVTADSLRSVSDETMRALLSCKDVGSGRAHLAAIINALRAQPPAREDAQPVGLDVLKGWEDPKTPSVPGPVAWRCRNIGGVWSYGDAKQPNVAFCEPLYDHPAPDAQRVALTDLIENAVAARGCGLKNDPDGIVSSALFDTIMNARQALAALQAEQKGGA